MKIVKRIKLNPQTLAQDLQDTRRDIAQLQKRAVQFLYEKVYYKAGKHIVVAYAVYPKEQESRKDIPTIVYLRGGNRDFGKLDSTSLLTRLTLIASWGYRVLAPQYPGVDGGEGFDSFGGAEDIASVTSLPNVAKELGFNSEKIGLWGVSRGGTMSYLALKHSNNFKAAAVWNAPSDQQRMIKERPEMLTLFRKLFNPNKTELQKRSALLWAEKIPSIPLLLIHAENDERVSISHSQKLSEKLRRLKHPHLYMPYPTDHSMKDVLSEALVETQKWFSAHLYN